MSNTQRTDEQPWTCRGCGVPISLDKGMNDVLSHKCHTTADESVVDWEKRLKDLKCVNGAMYFGSVEDDSCDCKTRCQNEQTYEHALEELTAFIHTHIENARREERERIQSVLKGHIMSAVDFAMYCAKGNMWDVDQREKYAQEVEEKLIALSNPPSQV